VLIFGIQPGELATNIVLLAVTRRTLHVQHAMNKPNPEKSAMDDARLRNRTLKSLTGKTALVTGASRGIGRAIAFALSGAGAQVIVHYAQDETAANSVVAEIRANGGRAQTVMSDLATKDGAHRLAEDTQGILGERLDILVANAGISLAADLEQTGVDQFDRLYAVNVRAPYFLVQQLLPSMFADSSIILISSLAARAAVGNLPAYAATKGAIESLVKHFAAALGEKGIRVNAVAPGVVDTDMSNFTKTDAGRQRTLSLQALKRIAQPADIAAVIAFLASEEARWITGEIVHVDGGSRL
jgi:NAD(P)-dependent dehydrogenase (short-subunit alcohol dehydrogenase family)